MKPRKPLRRDTPKSKAWANAPRKRLPPKSAKRKAEEPERARVVAAALLRDGGCVAAALVPSVACGGRLDGHEPIPRSEWAAGYLVLWNVVTVCRRHHDWIHFEDPAAAKAVGLLHPEAPCQPTPES